MTIEPTNRENDVGTIKVRVLHRIRKLSSVQRAISLYLIIWLGCAVLLFRALRTKTTAREVIVTSTIAAAALLIVGARLYSLVSALRHPRRRGY
jgi:prolipoprotein diacylglyceryltransferase